MADEVKWKCPFCGSSTLKRDTPYVDRITHKKIQTYCCKAQTKNNDYINKRFERNSRPDVDEVSKI